MFRTKTDWPGPERAGPPRETEVRISDSPHDEGPRDPAGPAGNGEDGSEISPSGRRGPDPTSTESDQTLADAEQTAADSDQTAADLDEAASDSDQAASDSDQAASDRDLAQGGDREVLDASAGSRDRATEQRLEGARTRAQGASTRDAVAKARDRAAEARDRAADQLDRELEARDAEWTADRPDDSPSKASANRARAAADRRRAAEARRRAASDREQAAEDRRQAARYRAEAREEHAALLRQISISETDPLTGARARAPGLADLEVEIIRAQRTAGQLAVAYVDVVGLKAVNDSRGHAAGDALLETTVRLIRAHLRPYDVIIRIGGDEFVCALSGATIEDARQRFEEIQADAAAAGVGIKFGIASLRPGDGPSDIIERADSELLPNPNPLDDQPRAFAPRPRDVGQPRILVTDNRPEMRVIVEDALADRYSLEFASSPEEAGKVLAGKNFDLLLCDLHSGGESAMSMARETVEANRDTAVILIAEEDDPVAAESAFEFGAFGHVVRPMPGQLLITTMNALRRRDLEIAHRARSQNREDRSQTIIDMAPIPIYAKDLAGRYIVANSKADELAGLRRGELVGRTDVEILAPDQMEVGTASDRRVLEEKAPHEREDAVEMGGVTKVFKSVRFPLLDEMGEVDAVGGISVDITAETEAGRLRDELAATQKTAIEELRLSRLETIEGLSKAIDLHDSTTGSHTKRMGSIAAFLGSRLGMDPDRVQLLRAAAPMHDVGKIGTPPEILRKPGPLSEKERGLMQTHTVIGHEIFSQFKSELARLAAAIALGHHERFDGSGYPHGVASEEIPLEARITAVADVFDALLSDRSYRAAMSEPEAVAVMKDGRGTQFDPQVVDVLLGGLDEALSVRAGE